MAVTAELRLPDLRGATRAAMPVLRQAIGSGFETMVRREASRSVSVQRGGSPDGRTWPVDKGRSRQLMTHTVTRNGFVIGSPLPYPQHVERSLRSPHRGVLANRFNIAVRGNEFDLDPWTRALSAAMRRR